METKEITEIQARQSEKCLACGNPKAKGLLICWKCFKLGDNPLKYSSLSFNEWLKTLNKIYD